MKTYKIITKWKTEYPMESNKTISQLEKEILTKSVFYTNQYIGIKSNDIESIEVVNQSPTEQNNKCEWEILRTGYGRRIVTTGCNKYKTTGLAESIKWDDFKYCPYCGKTISIRG